MERRSLGGEGAEVGTPTAIIIPQHTIPRNNIRTLQQTRLDTTVGINEPWGDSINTKRNNVIRIGFRNIRSLPADCKDERNKHFSDDIPLAQLDIYGVSEVNLAWHKLSFEAQPTNRFRSLFEKAKIIACNNRTDLECQPSQQGGTLLGIFNDHSHRVIEIGFDKRNLGRWCWTLLQGANDSQLIVVSVYRPCQTMGATTIYSQQRRLLQQTGISICPRIQFWNDLRVELQEWTDQGYNIVIGGDFNQPVGEHSIKEFFQDFGMRESITTIHTSTAPGTHKKGSTPIDGIFCTASLTIKACGYTPVKWGIFTDHRLIWVDICAVSALGHNAPRFISPKARKLQVDNPDIAYRYLCHRLQLMSKNKLFERTQALYDKVVGGARDINTIIELEKLDTIRTSNMLEAEQRCRKIKAGNVAWSPIFQDSINLIRYLRVLIRKLKGHDIHSRTLYKLHQRLKSPCLVNTLVEAEAKLMEELSNYRSIKTEAVSKRQSFLENLAITKADKSGVDYDIMLKQLKLREYQRSLARQLKRLKGSFMQGLNEIEETHDDSTIFLRDKAKIEKACATEGKRRFTQATSSPSLLPSQIDLLGWTADTDAADSILRGEIPEELHEDLAHIVSFLQKPPNILHEPEINCLMSIKEFAHGWKRSKEHTSSGMSGLHFGHFKADLEHEKTLQINHQLLQMAIILGYSMLRWQRAIDVMIPKKSNSKRVEKLRVICLMEADFNFMNKWMGKITMKRAESSHTIAAEQFGSRKNKSAILHAFNKALCFDYLRLTRTNASLSVLDAKACYDRIPPPLACLCLRRQGLPQTIIDASFNTIKDMKHHIRTAFGVSKLSYDRGDDYMHGILQGNGAGPCIWVMLSSPLLDKLKSDGFGVTLNVPDQEPLQVVGFAFVDDVDIIQVLPDEDPIPIVQEELDSWRQGLNTASGALEWSKCDVYLLMHKWNMKTSLWKIASMEQCPGDIFINDNGKQRALRRQEPHKATLSLGVQFAPDGSMKDQVTHLRTKAEQWADLLRVKKMQRDAVWYSLTASIMKTIEYPLLATSISQAQFQYIMAPILATALPQAGIYRYMNRDVIYSLPLHQGMGIPDPFVTQGLRKLFELLHEPCKANPALPFLSSALSSLATFSGLGPNFLLYPPTKRMLGMIDNSLCRSLWEFLHVYGIQVKKLVKCDKQFDQDEYIMKRIYASSYSTADLRIFNYCRIFLQVSRLSEIISINGKGIRRHILEGQRVRHVIDKTCWFDQPCPAKPAWNKFRNMLAGIYSTRQNGIFVSQLNITSWNRSRWKWFYCPDTSNLFEAIAHNKYLSYAILHHNNRRSERSVISFSKIGYPSDNIPSAATPVTVFLYPKSISMDPRQPLPQHCPNLDIPRWTDHLQIQRQGELVEFEQEYLKNNLILVSDGSYKDGVGSAAWIITSKQNQKIFIKGQCPTMGEPKSQDSHRSELFGILGGIFLLHKYVLLWNQPIGTITVGCDNTSAIAYAFDKYRYPVAMSSYPDFDVIQSIRSLCLQCINFVTLHIPGHQDDYIGPYDFESTLNIPMDSDAKRMRKTKTPLTDFVSFPNQMYQLSFNNKYICKQLQSSIREGISSNTMQKYWNKKSQVESNVFPLISWQEVGKAMKQNKPEKRHWLVKHATGNCGVNAILVHRKKKESPNCLRCREYEDSIHVWKCQHHTTSELWDNKLEELRIWLVSANTSPYIIESLIGGLKNWYSGSNLRPWCPLIKSQHLVGWNNIILGRCHQTWQETQHNYLIANHSKKSASAWLTKLILQLWKIAWKLWLVRNEYEHKHDAERRNIEFSNSIEVEIAIGFDNLPNSHRQMFSDNEITYLRTKARLEYKRQWLENIKACRFAQTSASIQTPIVYNAPMPI